MVGPKSITKPAVGTAFKKGVATTPHPKLQQRSAKSGAIVVHSPYKKGVSVEVNLTKDQDDYRESIHSCASIFGDGSEIIVKKSFSNLQKVAIQIAISRFFANLWNSNSWGLDAVLAGIVETQQPLIEFGSAITDESKRVLISSLPQGISDETIAMEMSDGEVQFDIEDDPVARIGEDLEVIWNESQNPEISDYSYSGISADETVRLRRFIERLVESRGLTDGDQHEDIVVSVNAFGRNYTTIKILLSLGVTVVARESVELLESLANYRNMISAVEKGQLILSNYTLDAEKLEYDIKIWEHPWRIDRETMEANLKDDGLVLIQTDIENAINEFSLGSYEHLFRRSGLHGNDYLIPSEYLLPESDAVNFTESSNSHLALIRRTPEAKSIDHPQEVKPLVSGRGPVERVQESGSSGEAFFVTEDMLVDGVYRVAGAGSGMSLVRSGSEVDDPRNSISRAVVWDPETSEVYITDNDGVMINTRDLTQKKSRRIADTDYYWINLSSHVLKSFKEYRKFDGFGSNRNIMIVRSVGPKDSSRPTSVMVDEDTTPYMSSAQGLGHYVETLGYKVTLHFPDGFTKKVDLRIERGPEVLEYDEFQQMRFEAIIDAVKGLTRSEVENIEDISIFLSQPWQREVEPGFKLDRSQWGDVSVYDVDRVIFEGRLESELKRGLPISAWKLRPATEAEIKTLSRDLTVSEEMPQMTAADFRPEGRIIRYETNFFSKKIVTFRQSVRINDGHEFKLEIECRDVKEFVKLRDSWIDLMQSAKAEMFQHVKVIRLLKHNSKHYKSKKDLLSFGGWNDDSRMMILYDIDMDGLLDPGRREQIFRTVTHELGGHSRADRIERDELLWRAAVAVAAMGEAGAEAMAGLLRGSRYFEFNADELIASGEELFFDPEAFPAFATKVEDLFRVVRDMWNGGMTVVDDEGLPLSPSRLDGDGRTKELANLEVRTSELDLELQKEFPDLPKKSRDALIRAEWIADKVELLKYIAEKSGEETKWVFESLGSAIEAVGQLKGLRFAERVAFLKHIAEQSGHGVSRAFDYLGSAIEALARLEGMGFAERITFLKDIAEKSGIATGSAFEYLARGIEAIGRLEGLGPAGRIDFLKYMVAKSGDGPDGVFQYLGSAIESLGRLEGMETAERIGFLKYIVEKAGYATGGAFRHLGSAIESLDRLEGMGTAERVAFLKYIAEKSGDATGWVFENLDRGIEALGRLEGLESAGRETFLKYIAEKAGVETGSAFKELGSGIEAVNRLEGLDSAGRVAFLKYIVEKVGEGTGSAFDYLGSAIETLAQLEGIGPAERVAFLKYIAAKSGRLTGQAFQNLGNAIEATGLLEGLTPAERIDFLKYLSEKAGVETNWAFANLGRGIEAVGMLEGLGFAGRIDFLKYIAEKAAGGSGIGIGNAFGFLGRGIEALDFLEGIKSVERPAFIKFIAEKAGAETSKAFMNLAKGVEAVGRLEGLSSAERVAFIKYILETAGAVTGEVFSRLGSAVEIAMQLGMSERDIFNLAQNVATMESGSDYVYRSGEILRGMIEVDNYNFRMRGVQIYGKLSDLFAKGSSDTLKEFRAILDLVFSKKLEKEFSIGLADILYKKNHLFSTPEFWQNVFDSGWLKGTVSGDLRDFLKTFMMSRRVYDSYNGLKTVLSYLMDLNPEKERALEYILSSAGKPRKKLRAIRELNNIPQVLIDSGIFRNLLTQLSAIMDDAQRNGTPVSVATLVVDYVRDEIVTFMRDKLNGDGHTIALLSETMPIGMDSARWTGIVRIRERLYGDGTMSLFAQAASYMDESGIRSLKRLLAQLETGLVAEGDVENPARYRELLGMGFSPEFVERWSRDSRRSLGLSRTGNKKEGRDLVVSQAHRQIETHSLDVRPAEGGLRDLPGKVSQFLEDLRVGRADETRTRQLLSYFEENHQRIISVYGDLFASIRTDLRMLLNGLEGKLRIASKTEEVVFTGSVGTMARVGSEPTVTCQKLYESHDINTNGRGQPINRLIHGQFKVANYMMDGVVVARRQMEITLDKEGNVWLIVEPLYTDGTFAFQDKFDAEIYGYAKELGISRQRVEFTDLGELIRPALRTGDEIYRDSKRTEIDPPVLNVRASELGEVGR